MAENLKGDGHEVIVSDTGLKHPLPEPGRFDAAFLAASLHVGRY